MRLRVVCTASRNIAARIDGNGCPPWIVSRTARSTKKAASDVASRVTTKLLMKFARSAWRFAIHPVPTAPPGNGAGTPNEGNHEMSPGSVVKTMAQNIHFAKFPPMTAVGPPSRRKLIPPRIRQSTAADGASSIIILMKSVRSCGAAIVLVLESWQVAHGRDPPARLPKMGLRDSASPLLYPELQKARYAGDHKQADGGERPACEASTGSERNDRRQRCATSANRSDHVADPVDQVQPRAFRLRTGLALDRHVRLGR